MTLCKPGLTYQQARLLYVPTNAQPITKPGLDAVAYAYESKGNPCAAGFIGKQSKPDLRYRYRTATERDAAITKWLDMIAANIAQRAASRAHYRAEDKRKAENGESYTPAYVAKIARARLAEAWPSVKFSVTSENYTGGSSIDVRWLDGPTVEQAEALVGGLHNGHFDGMDDSMSYDDSPYKCTFIFCSRDISLPNMQAACDQVCSDLGIARVAVTPDSKGTSGYIGYDAARDCAIHNRMQADLSTLVYRAARTISYL